MEVLKPYREVAVEVALEAGKLLQHNLAKKWRVEFKGAVDLVTEMDRAAEDLIVDRFREEFPRAGILAEERDELVADSRYRWIIDPLDGTTNYTHGFPFFCVSIALEEDGEVVLGVAYNPNLDELFVAEKGKGASLNGDKITVSGTTDLSKALLATGFPYDIRTSKENNIDEFSRFAVRAQAVRRAGSAVLDFCYVACGRFDGFWEMKLKPWDMAAGVLMVREAGGMVTDFKGAEFSLDCKGSLASNGRIHEEMVAVLKGV